MSVSSQGQAQSIIKEELPLSSDKEIADLFSLFETCKLPYINWTHRAHLAVAVFYSQNMNFEKALSRIRKNINAYNNTCGDPAGYNETITRVFMRKIYSELNADKNCQHQYEEVARLEKLCTIDWLYNYYSRDLIWSANAKSNWLAPNITQLDF